MLHMYVYLHMHAQIHFLLAEFWVNHTVKSRCTSTRIYAYDRLQTELHEAQKAHSDSKAAHEVSFQATLASAFKPYVLYDMAVLSLCITFH